MGLIVRCIQFAKRQADFKIIYTTTMNSDLTTFTAQISLIITINTINIAYTNIAYQCISPTFSFVQNHFVPSVLVIAIGV